MERYCCKRITYGIKIEEEKDAFLVDPEDLFACKWR